MHTCLIICAKYDYRECLEDILSSGASLNYVVASDDVRIHELVLNNHFAEKTFWINQMDTVYDVSDAVIRTINSVNQWYKNEVSASDFLKEMLQWPLHCEGGFTSQAVLNFFLFEKSFEYLIHTVRPNFVYFIDENSEKIEISLVKSILKNYGIPLKIRKTSSPAIILKKKMWGILRPFAIAAYQTLEIIKTKLRRSDNKNNYEKYDGAVCIQLKSSSKNHLNHTKELARALSREGLNPLVLGWSLGDGADDLRRSGISFVELEHYVTLSDVLLSWVLVLIALAQARIRINKLNFSHCTNIDPLKKIVSQSALEYFSRELIGHAIYKCACRRFFSIVSINAFRPSTLILADSIIFSKEIYRASPNAQIFINGGWPYNVKMPITDLAPLAIEHNRIFYFASSELHKKILIENGFASEKIKVTGLHWVESILAFKRSNTKFESRQFLNLPDAKWYLLLDTNYVLPGYLSSQEQQVVLSSLIHFAQDRPECCLMVKPHPGARDVVVEALMAGCAKDNVIMISKQTLPYHAVNASDLLLTKASTLALEAMYLDVPSVCWRLDGEDQWDFYGRGVEYVYSIDRLLLLLGSLFDKKSIRVDWEDEMKFRREEFFSLHGIPTSEDSIQILAKTIGYNSKYHDVNE